MVHALILLLALFANPAHALTVGNVGTVEVCGQVLSTTNLIHLFGRACSSNNRTSMWRAGDTASAYSAGKGTAGGSNAANGKAFRLVIVQYTVGTAGTGNNGVELFYADNDVGYNSAGSFTNGVNFVGNGSALGYVKTAQNATSANNTMDPRVTCVPHVNWLIANGKFPSAKTDGTACAMVEYWGYEE